VRIKPLRSDIPGQIIGGNLGPSDRIAFAKTGVPERLGIWKKGNKIPYLHVFITSKRQFKREISN
jgi:hypothetical protein